MLFGNNMSWLYGKLKKKLDAPATAGSAGDVLKLGESGKPEWGEGGGGGGDAIVLYLTLSVPEVAGLPDPLMPDAEWQADDEQLPVYASYEPNGDALTYEEILSVYEAAISGTPVFIKGTRNDTDYHYFIKQTGYSLVNEIDYGFALIEFMHDESQGVYIRYAYKAESK